MRHPSVVTDAAPAVPRPVERQPSTTGARVPASRSHATVPPEQTARGLRFRSVRALHGARTAWALGALAYAVAQLNRTSLAVAAPLAQQRFHLGATGLGVLTALQLLCYACAQLPAGLVADRYGPRAALTGALLCMGAGQAVLAFVPGFTPAMVSRVLVGAGDGFVYLATLRLCASWFPQNRFAAVNNLTGAIGAIGQLCAALPLAQALHLLGWQVSFGAVSTASALLALVVALLLRDRPRSAPVPAPAPVGAAVLGAALRSRGVHLAVAAHLALMGPFVVFNALWGYTFLTQCHGLAPTTAQLLLTAGVGVTASVSWITGRAAARAPEIRVPLVIGVTGAHLAGWLLLWTGGPVSTVALFLLPLLVGGSGGVALLSFSFAKEDCPPQSAATYCGVVNVIGFATALLSALAVGVLRDHLPGSPQTALGWAVLPIPALALAGLLALLRLRRPALRRPRG
ncbi:MFS transporter [Kitasatospora sp. MMS16-BH015]|uniref:MFS transporter n=1 Tax=Kitasatospora sp. MMS16-BH015 TaxID=2018025 RepID=UPI000CA1A26A|nr:MFS transporter [Kitasatospora sp. MMS16-BH015]AUG76963.1 MFS transporter [Kitasatospora sp. MMS16-BH015]